MKVKSEADSTFGTTRVVRLGDLTSSSRSCNARPEPTELIRTALSLIPSGLDLSNSFRTSALASALRPGVTLSSRSYATQSTDNVLDLSRNFCDEPGTTQVSSRLHSFFRYRLGVLPYNIALRIIFLAAILTRRVGPSCLMLKFMIFFLLKMVYVC